MRQQDGRRGATRSDPRRRRRRQPRHGGSRAPAPAAPAAAHAAKPAAPRPPAAPLPDLAGKTTTAASVGGAQAKAAAAAPAAAKPAVAAGRDRRRHVAAADSPRLAGPRVGRVLGRVGRRARRDRPFHVPERAQRAAAAVQGRLPERVRHGRRRAVQGQVRHLDRPDAGRHRSARQRLLRADQRVHAPRAARRTTCRRKASSSAPATAAASA